MQRQADNGLNTVRSILLTTSVHAFVHTACLRLKSRQGMHVAAQGRMPSHLEHTASILITSQSTFLREALVEVFGTVASPTGHPISLRERSYHRLGIYLIS